MSTVRGLVLGVAGLALAEAVVSSQTASNNAGGAVTLISDGLSRWLNPYTPLIPNLAASAPALPPGTAPINTPGTTGKLTRGGPFQPVNPPSSTTLPPGAGVTGSPYPV